MQSNSPVPVLRLLDVDPEPLLAPSVLGLGTAPVLHESCAGEPLRVYGFAPADIQTGSDPVGPAEPIRRGAHLIASIWQRPASVLGESQRLSVPLCAQARDVTHESSGAGFLRCSTALHAPGSTWNHAVRADLYAAPGTFVVWGIARETERGEPGLAVVSSHLAGVYVTDGGPVSVAPATLHDLLMRVDESALRAADRELWRGTIETLSTRAVRAERVRELEEVSAALCVVESLYGRRRTNVVLGGSGEPGRVRAADLPLRVPAGLSADAEAAMGSATVALDDDDDVMTPPVLDGATP